MATKTYQIGLLIALEALRNYATRYQLKLQQFLTEPQYACLIAVIEAVTECLSALGARPVE